MSIDSPVGGFVLAAISMLALSTPRIAGEASVTVSPVAYTGMCDASAAMALPDGRFVVANDEDNTLRGYTLGEPKPAFEVSLTSFLAADREADIEGAAQIGNVIYWITSHGRNKDGRVRPDRLNFFATRIVTEDGHTTLRLEGRPNRLLMPLIQPVLDARGLGAAPTKPPEAADGLNIEGLAASGDALLIGFRNPIPGGKALVVELTNPAALIAEPTTTPKPGRVFELNLGGRGIRSVEALPGGQGFTIVAGGFGDTADFALYLWPGLDLTPTRVEGLTFEDFRPEAMFAGASPRSMVLLSDDGDALVDGKPCKDNADARKKRFRLATVTLD